MPRAAKIYSFADAMRRSNWATIWSRWRRWAVLNGGMPGARVDREQRVRPALRKAKRRLLNFCKDALGLNRLLLGELQAAAAACRGAQDEFHVYHQACVAHQTVLSMNPSIDRIPGVSSNLVRLGHLFQSHRWIAKWNKSCDMLADSSEFRDVIEMPEEAGAWEKSKRDLLALTRGAKDMIAADEEFLLMMMNLSLIHI